MDSRKQLAGIVIVAVAVVGLTGCAPPLLPSCRDAIATEMAARHGVSFGQLTVRQRAWSKLDKPRPELGAVAVGEVLFTNVEVSLPGSRVPTWRVYCENPAAFPQRATHVQFTPITGD